MPATMLDDFVGVVLSQPDIYCTNVLGWEKIKNAT
jgi:hypothetical protein